jgi:hypothetical protein
METRNKEIIEDIKANPLKICIQAEAMKTTPIHQVRGDAIPET